MRYHRLVAAAGVAAMALAPHALAQEQAAHHGGAAAEKAAPAAEPEQAKDEAQLMREEIQRLNLEYELMQTRSKHALAEAEMRRREIEARQALRRAEQAEALATLNAEVERMRAEQSLRQAARQAELQEIEEKAARANAEHNYLAAETKRLRSTLDILNANYATKTAEMESQLNYLNRKQAASNHVLTEVGYPLNPLINGTLFISDRRIPLNGAIGGGTASYVTERIHFFNNQCTQKPIFIVIDSSPGGSVMEGYRIVKAIESSRAPIHVVVKSYAASMAAVITTLAPHSHAYPNAIILHHEMSYGQSGNMTQHRERLRVSEEWMARLAEPVAKKMGVSLERFVELMYENNSNGDWAEFADRAAKIKWVNNVVSEIREDGVTARPTTSARGSFFAEHEQVDPTSGKRFIRLPMLESPFDFYAIYDPDNYYRP